MRIDTLIGDISEVIRKCKEELESEGLGFDDDVMLSVEMTAEEGEAVIKALRLMKEAEGK